jgi:hypothetical protein
MVRPPPGQGSANTPTARVRARVIAAACVAVLSIGSAAVAADPINDPATATGVADRIGNPTQTKPTPPPAPGTFPGQVVNGERIIDGDTIDVGWDENIRMLG